MKHYQTSLEIRTSSLPAQHPSIAETLENIARIYEAQRDFSQALTYFQRAHAIYRRSGSSNSDKLTQIEAHIRRISQQR